MAMNTTHTVTRITDPKVLADLRRGLSSLYGDRLVKLILFGSRARGDARPDSDYDIAVFLRDFSWGDQPHDRMLDAGLAIFDDTEALNNASLYPVGGWRDRTIFMAEVRRDGIDI